MNHYCHMSHCVWWWHQCDQYHILLHLVTSGVRPELWPGVCHDTVSCPKSIIYKTDSQLFAVTLFITVTSFNHTKIASFKICMKLVCWNVRYVLSFLTLFSLVMTVVVYHDTITVTLATGSSDHRPGTCPHHQGGCSVGTMPCSEYQRE